MFEFLARLIKKKSLDALISHWLNSNNINSINAYRLFYCSVVARPSTLQGSFYEVQEQLGPIFFLSLPTLI